MKRTIRLTDSGQLLAIKILNARPYCGAYRSSPYLNFILITLGVILLTMGLSDTSFAVRTTQYNDQRLVEAINAVLSYLEGSFGALVMVCAGVGAILSAAFGQYRASLGLLVVAIGSFILRSLISTFFNDVGIQE